MSEQKESSVLFNLRELMNLEEDRVRSETEQQQKLAEDARLAKEAEERKVREQLEAKQRAEDEARMARERELREEQARLESEKEQAALRVRLEADAKARQEEQERALTHEAELKRIEATRRKGVHPAVFVIAVLLVLGGGAGYYFGVIQPKQVAAEMEAQRQRQAAEEAQQAIATLRQEQAALTASLAAARQSGDATRIAELEARIAANTDAIQSGGRPAAGAGPRRPRPAGGGNKAPGRPADGLGGSRGGNSDDPLGGL